MVSNNFIMHIVSATTAIISLILLMASVYYGLYEQWIYVAICIVRSEERRVGKEC